MSKSKEDLDQAISNAHTYNITPNTREIYLHAYYKSEDDVEPGVDWRMATQFVKNLRILDVQNHNQILIHMQSVGGCWENGMAIFNAIQMTKSPVTILAYAQASSMTGVILQSAKKRVLMPDCYLMLHHGSISLDHTSTAAKQAIDMNEKACKRMLEIFASRAIRGRFFKGKTLEYAKRFLNKKMHEKHDWYLDSQEAVEYGLADGILGTRRFKTIDDLLTK